MGDGALIVLAAGAGTRLGGVAKALLPLGDVTFLARILATAGVAARHALVVVGAPFAAEVAAAARGLGAGVVVNPAPARGMASSIACGFAAAQALPPAVTWALLWPVDHPRVTPATVRRLIAARAEAPAIVPTFVGRGGHPVVVARALWAALAACADAADGARGVLRPVARRLAVDDDGVVRDVDEPADRLAAEAG